MIKVKDLEHGYTIEYDNEGYAHNFFLRKDGEVVKEDHNQAMLEQYAEKIGKADNKFKTPIKALMLQGYDKRIVYGTITSANLLDESLWFSRDEEARWGKRSKEKIGSTIYERTPVNDDIIVKINAQETIIKNAESEIQGLKTLFEKQITKEYIAAKQESKKEE